MERWQSQVQRDQPKIDWLVPRGFKSLSLRWACRSMVDQLPPKLQIWVRVPARPPRPFLTKKENRKASYLFGNSNMILLFLCLMIYTIYVVN